MIMAFGNVFLGILLHAMNWRMRELHNVLTRGRLAVAASSRPMVVDLAGKADRGLLAG
jgi:hypothetical protein